MTDEERPRGVVAVSGGNHAQAVAYASSVLGVDAVILMPENTPQNYLDATRGYGATLDLRPTIAEAFAGVKKYQAEGRVFVHPFDDPLVIAGQGTVGLEIMEDMPEVTDVIASIGGGGMAGGVAMAVKAKKPGVRVWGVETVGADAMAQAIAAGRPVDTSGNHLDSQNAGRAGGFGADAGDHPGVLRKRNGGAGCRGGRGDGVYSGAAEGADRALGLVHTGGGRTAKGQFRAGYAAAACFLRRELLGEGPVRVS